MIARRIAAEARIGLTGTDCNHGGSSPFNRARETRRPSRRRLRGLGTHVDASEWRGRDAAAAPAGDLIKDTTTQTFVEDVIEESQGQPVLVDFWAPWCGPCKQLTPILEKVVKAAKGKVKLVKMNIDEHPADPRPDGHPVDPGGHRLQERPAGRRLHGRAARKPGQGVHRAPHQGRGRRRGRGSAEGRRERWPQATSTGAAEIYSALLAEDPDNMPAHRRPRALLMSQRGALEQAKQTSGAGAREQAQRRRDRRRARRARTRRAGASARRRSPSSSRRSPPIRTITRRASISPSRSTPRASAKRRSTSCSRSSGATASGTTTARASSWSSSSRPGARPTRRRVAGRKRCRRCCSRELSRSACQTRPVAERTTMPMNAIYRGPADLPEVIPVFPLAGRAAAAARADAAQHFRAALPRDGRRRAEQRRPADRHDPARPRRIRGPRGHAEPLPDRLRRPHHAVRRDRRRPLPDQLTGVCALPRRRGARRSRRPIASAASAFAPFADDFVAAQGEDDGRPHGAARGAHAISSRPTISRPTGKASRARPTRRSSTRSSMMRPSAPPRSRRCSKRPTQDPRRNPGRHHRDRAGQGERAGETPLQ